MTLRLSTPTTPVCGKCARAIFPEARFSTLRSRSELVTTEIDEALIAKAANIGLISMPSNGIEHAGRDRHADGIVDQREEQVLADIAHRRPRQAPGAHDAVEIALDQRDAGAFDRDIGAGAHGDADIGLRQRGRVVHAVARHGDLAALLLQFLDDPRLVLAAARRRGSRRCRAWPATALAVRSLSPVAMMMRKPSSCSSFSAAGVVSLTGSATLTRPASRAVDHHEHHGLALVAARIGLSPAARRVERRDRQTSFAVAERDRLAVDRAFDALAGHRLEVARPRRASSPRSCAPLTIASASGCSEPRFERRRKAQHLGFVVALPRAAPRPASACPRSACRSCRRSACRPSRTVRAPRRS